MTSKVRIRTTKNLALISEMDAVCFPRETMDDAKKHVWFIAYVDGKPAGYAGLKHCSADVGFLSRAGVLPAFRGNGLQKKLIRARERYARKQGMSWLVTYTLWWGVLSPNSLVSCGYKLYRPANKWAGREWLYFRRKISR